MSPLRIWIGILLFGIFSFASNTALNLPSWIERQMELVRQSNEANLTQERIAEIIDERDKLYDKAIDTILADKNLLQKGRNRYDKTLFRLQKMIDINKRQGNKLAVLRDEVALKSYRLLRLQNAMINRIFDALERYDAQTFEKKMYEIFLETSKKIEALDDPAYKAWLRKNPKNRIERQIKRNIEIFYALKEINADIMRYFASDAMRIYRYNRFSRFPLLKPLFQLTHAPVFEETDAWLREYGMSVVKLTLMLIVTLVILFLRKVALRSIERLLLRMRFIDRYVEEILDDVRTPLSLLLLVVNIQLILAIYNDFNNYEWASKTFRIIYTLFVTYIIYKTINGIARVKLETFNRGGKHIKSELFNLSVKIVNFIVILIGSLFVLHFAGVDLTAVLSGLGIGGFAVALAARESLSNFFGTVSILMSDIFSQGDWIQADDKEGHVVEIGLRVTTIRTFDNALIAIPNAKLANSEVKNWSRRVIGRRMKMKIRLRYDAPREALQRTVEEIRELFRSHPGIATEKTAYTDRKDKSAKIVSKEDELGVKRNLMIYLDTFGESSIDILVYAFTKSTAWKDWLEVKEELMYGIMEIVERNGLAFAYPTITIDTECET
jgi:MscS family membrane protein